MLGGVVLGTMRSTVSPLLSALFAVWASSSTAACGAASVPATPEVSDGGVDGSAYVLTRLETRAGAVAIDAGTAVGPGEGVDSGVCFLGEELVTIPQNGCLTFRAHGVARCASGAAGHVFAIAGAAEALYIDLVVRDGDPSDTAAIWLYDTRTCSCHGGCVSYAPAEPGMRLNLSVSPAFVDFQLVGASATFDVSVCDHDRHTSLAARPARTPLPPCATIAWSIACTVRCSREPP